MKGTTSTGKSGSVGMRVDEFQAQLDEADRADRLTFREGCRGLIVLTLISWVIVGLMGAAVYWLFNA